MKCNICGGELPYGERKCKYCGNVIKLNVDEQKPHSEPIKPENEVKPINNNQADAKIYANRRTNPAVFCTRCGRPLDGLTHKCVVCDAVEVGRRVYNHDDRERLEAEEMAQKRKKKEQHTVRNIILAIIGMIILFTLTLFLTFGKFSEILGIGDGKNKNQQTENTNTRPPKVTADPNWEATTEPAKTATPEPEKKPVRTPVPAEKGDPVKLRGGEYLYPSDTHLISIDELNEMDRNEVKYTYWEIYARHGYTFDDDELTDYFETNHKWYMPTTSDKAKVESEFNDIEKRNITTIFDYQKRKGWR